MLQRLGRVFEKEKERLKEGLKIGHANNPEAAKNRQVCVQQLQASYKALLKVRFIV